MGWDRDGLLSPHEGRILTCVAWREACGSRHDVHAPHPGDRVGGHEDLATWADLPTLESVWDVFMQGTPEWPDVSTEEHGERVPDTSPGDTLRDLPTAERPTWLSCLGGKNDEVRPCDLLTFLRLAWHSWAQWDEGLLGLSHFAQDFTGTGQNLPCFGIRHRVQRACLRQIPALSRGDLEANTRQSDKECIPWGWNIHVGPTWISTCS